MKITVRQLKHLIRETVFAEPVKIKTSGKFGQHYSSRAANEGITITKLTLDLSDYEHWMRVKRPSDKAYARLKVYYANPSAAQRNLDYTDVKFMKEFRNILRTLGFSDKVVGQIRYTTAGTRYGTYAPMIVNEEFVREWEDLVGAPSIEL